MKHRRHKRLVSRLTRLPKIIWVWVGLATLLILTGFPIAQLPVLEPTKEKITISNFSPAPFPKLDQTQPPEISARSIFIIDRASKTVIYQKQADLKVYPASTTKMMTALVVLENFPLDQVFTVTKSYPIGQNVGLAPGEKLTAEQLLYALLVQSGNDAAEVLAENFPGGRDRFIDRMNTLASELHLTNTQYKNPTGIDEDGHYSTAVDLARLADVALRNTEFSRIVSTENAVVNSHVLNNVNLLLGKIPGVIGIKTGYTEKAGQALVTLVERDGHQVILVVLGSLDRFSDSEKLITWVFGHVTWQLLTPDTVTQ